MRRVFLLVLMCVLLTIPFALTSVHAQAPTTSTATTELEKSIHACEQEVARWRRQASIEITIAVAVILFGVAVSSIHRSNTKWARNVTLVLGLCTAALTAINSRVFLADDRSLQRAAFEGDSVISQLWVMAGSIKEASPQDKITLQADYLKKLTEFHSIGAKLNGNAGSEVAQNWGILLRVYAQSSVPGWVEKAPYDGTSLYYVGKDSDKSVTSAKQKSLDDAYHNAVLELRLHAPKASDPALLAFVKASAVIQDSALTYDKSAGSYTCYTLLRLSREIQNVGVASLAPAVSAQSAPTKFQDKSWAPGDLTFNPDSGMFALDSNGGVSRLVSDQGGSSRIEKLFRAKGGYALTSTGDSVFVAFTTQLGCTIQKYSLATKAVSQRLIAPREHCGGIATDGRALYITSTDRNEIICVDSWEAANSRRWTVAGASSPDTMTFDAIGHRLIVADATGNAYAVSVPDGKTQQLISNLGSVTSIAASQLHILFASGKKVLFVGRSSNEGENPPAGLESLTGGHIVGVVVDKTGALWFADFDNKLVEGPFPVI